MFLPCLFAVFLPYFTVFQYSLHFIVVKVTFSYSCCAFWVQIVYGMERSFNEDGNGRDPEFTLPLIHVDEIFMSKLGPNGTGSSGRGRGKVSGCFCVPPRFITVWRCLDHAFHVFFLFFFRILYSLIGTIFVVNVFDSCADVFAKSSAQMLNLWLLGSSCSLRQKVVTTVRPASKFSALAFVLIL